MNVYPHAHVSALGLGRKISEYAKCLLITASLLTGVLVPLRADTIGGGTISSPAVGPGPSYGLGGAGAVLVKNWDFGAGGTIKNNADLSANFYYHDQFNTISNKYGAKIVSPDAANALPGQPMSDDSRVYRRFDKNLSAAVERSHLRESGHTKSRQWFVHG